jgi:hypothetical protein
MGQPVRLSFTAISLALLPRPACRGVCYLPRRLASFEDLWAGGQGDRLHPSRASLVLHELALAVTGVGHFLTFNPSSTRRQPAIGLSANRLRGSQPPSGCALASYAWRPHPQHSVDSAPAEPGL